MEALIGAIYLDGGMRKVTKVIKQLFSPFFTDEKLTEKNPKNMLRSIHRKNGNSLQGISSPGKPRVVLLSLFT
jgi:dsRNA-specific ribonuclease